jgi:hypothetical protein
LLVQMNAVRSRLDSSVNTFASSSALGTLSKAGGSCAEDAIFILLRLPAFSSASDMLCERNKWVSKEM